MKIIPERLKNIMAERHVTCGELSEVMHVRKETISYWRHGRKSITKAHLEELCDIFNVPEEYFTKENPRVMLGIDLIGEYIANNTKRFTKHQKLYIIRKLLDSMEED